MVIKKINDILFGLYRDHISVYHYLIISPNLAYHIRLEVQDGSMEISEHIIDVNQKVYCF